MLFLVRRGLLVVAPTCCALLLFLHVCSVVPQWAPRGFTAFYRTAVVPAAVSSDRCWRCAVILGGEGRHSDRGRRPRQPVPATAPTNALADAGGCRIHCPFPRQWEGEQNCGARYDRYLPIVRGRGGLGKNRGIARLAAEQTRTGLGGAATRGCLGTVSGQPQPAVQLWRVGVPPRIRTVHGRVWPPPTHPAAATTSQSPGPLMAVTGHRCGDSCRRGSRCLRHGRHRDGGWMV